MVRCVCFVIFSEFVVLLFSPPEITDKAANRIGNYLQGC